MASSPPIVAGRKAPPLSQPPEQNTARQIFFALHESVAGPSPPRPALPARQLSGVLLPRQQLADDSEIMDFLICYVGKFDMYVEDDYAAFVRYCFEDPLDAEIFRARFEPKDDRLRLAG